MCVCVCGCVGVCVGGCVGYVTIGACVLLSYVIPVLSPVFCYNNATSQTLNCIYDRCFERHLYWTIEMGLTISHTMRNYSHHISHLTFDYSSLPFGYHKLDVFYKYQQYSSLGRICSHHHCPCSFSSILDVSGQCSGCHASLCVYQSFCWMPMLQEHIL